MGGIEVMAYCASLDPGLTAQTEPYFALLLFDTVPDLIVNNPKLRHLATLPFFGRVGPGDPFARRRILYIGTAVPFQQASVEAIVQNASTAPGLATDRGIGPGSATWAGDARRKTFDPKCARSMVKCGLWACATTVL